MKKSTKVKNILEEAALEGGRKSETRVSYDSLRRLSYEGKSPEKMKPM